MVRTSAAEEVAAAQRMIWTLATEAVVISRHAQRMIRTLVADGRQGDQLKAKPMFWMPATEFTPVPELRQGFGAARTLPVERRRDGDGRGRRPVVPCGRRKRAQSECAEYDAVSQHAVYRSRSSHCSSPG